MDDMKELEMVTVSEAKQIFRVHRYTIYRWMKEGKLEGKRIGKKFLIKKSDIEELLK